MKNIIKYQSINPTLFENGSKLQDRLRDTSCLRSLYSQLTNAWLQIFRCQLQTTLIVLKPDHTNTTITRVPGTRHQLRNNEGYRKRKRKR